MKFCLALNYTEIVAIVTTIAAIVVVTLGILKMYYMIEDRKSKFSYEKFKENTGWKIMILHPDKLIYKFSITIDGKPIPISNSTNGLCERTLRVGEGENFDVPDNIHDDSKVVIQFDKNYKSMKYKDIPLFHTSSL